MKAIFEAAAKEARAYIAMKYEASFDQQQYWSSRVPTSGRPFEVIFRVYGPEKSFFEKTWKLPDIEAG
jgi:hypothetical protein